MRLGAGGDEIRLRAHRSSIHEQSSRVDVVSVADMHATIYAALGVDPHKELFDGDRPVPITDQDRDVCFDPPPHHLELDAGNPGCTYLWNTGETTQHILAERYGAYSVTITTQEGCSINGTIDLVEYCPPTIWMPSAFTPDADGVNDLFGPIGHNIATVELDIFDRWGELVYTGKDGDALWDGTVGGSLAPDGVYVWKIAYRFITDALGSQGNAEEAVGHVTLLR